MMEDVEAFSTHHLKLLAHLSDTLIVWVLVFSWSTIIGSRLIVHVLDLNNGECKYMMPCLRLCLLDLSLTVMSGKIITWFCKVMKTSPSTPPIESFTGVSRNNQVSRLPSYYLLEPPL